MCGYAGGKVPEIHQPPPPVLPAPIEIVRAMQHSQAKPWKRPLPRWLKEEDVMSGEKPGRPGKPFDPSKAKALRDKGLSIRGIALKLGVSVKRVRVALFGPRMASPVPLRAGPHVVPPSSDGCCSSCGAPALPAHQHEIFWELVSEGVAVRRAREIAVMVDKVAQRG